MRRDSDNKKYKRRDFSLNLNRGGRTSFSGTDKGLLRYCTRKERVNMREHIISVLNEEGGLLFPLNHKHSAKWMTH